MLGNEYLQVNFADMPRSIADHKFQNQCLYWFPNFHHLQHHVFIRICYSVWGKMWLKIAGFKFQLSAFLVIFSMPVRLSSIISKFIAILILPGLTPHIWIISSAVRPCSIPDDHSDHLIKDLFPTRWEEVSGFILQEIKGMIIFTEKLTANLFVLDG